MSNGQLHRASVDEIDAPTLYRLLQLRSEVFVLEQACPYQDLDGRDLEPDTRQLWITADDGTIASELRILRNTRPDGADTFQIGRVCTHRAYRGHGHTRRLMIEALAEVGDHECRVEAQKYLVDMYAGHGFSVVGEEYLEDGIPHVSMIRAPGGASSSGTSEVSARDEL